MGADSDVIDRMIADWQQVRPDLDASPLGVIGRVIVLARHLEQSVETVLKVHGLSLGQFDILATLRRHESKGGLNPTQLCENVMLTSGAMTSRLDRLQEAKLIARQADPADRRGVVVVLTPKGRKLIEAATATRFEEAADSLPKLSPMEMSKLEAGLRTWLAQYS
ncbi:MarR family winged helix-turn-helix transcriptional regulator [Limnoglobus roseus]|uniref:MarR family transcriptional regulator n=1 Tax=Limnoglobus roseus TaxID=2598579 RepID=A0A5C1ANN4_9BACT|nr:MarR family transcriptional regulator [Limnoglobus roseus]QEL18468.1 MarR family transcriptional regulator [Limnoglobus roseus]